MYTICTLHKISKLLFQIFVTRFMILEVAPRIIKHKSSGFECLESKRIELSVGFAPSHLVPRWLGRHGLRVRRAEGFPRVQDVVPRRLNWNRMEAPGTSCFPALCVVKLQPEDEYSPLAGETDLFRVKSISLKWSRRSSYREEE